MVKLVKTGEVVFKAWCSSKGHLDLIYIYSFKLTNLYVRLWRKNRLREYKHLKVIAKYGHLD